MRVLLHQGSLVSVVADVGCAPKSGVVRSEWTHQYRDRHGEGDFDFKVTINYSIDVRGEVSNIKLVGTEGMTREEHASALAAAETAARRYLASSEGLQAMIEAVLERVG